ncbi:diguanylate cyclase (GGDEF) domain-containing protein [Modicisalibacter muralis]|uniref:Diguanylate cyclase (GGDEF) domain-containing protein n=1 Tax=Modicisalibacter muralis TaxID=119000 RepID=A0A1G9M8N1_9GAMM|nr:bifunctional diguanylate cyclase/phosphodiesterase [Halomonas muralis]SDL70025.1 diguanylate cyclase (GGDEF) domain-containing protein [Halomonas muralis]
MILATLRRCLGLSLLCLALGTSRLAGRLLHPSRRRLRRLSGHQQTRLSGLQARLLNWQTQLQPQDIDKLTGVGTRQSALRELERLVDHNQPFSLIRLSVNNVKQINDTLGHAVGDQLLVALARRLMRLEFHRGRLYRLGGDEFVMLVIPPTARERLADRLRERLCQPLELEGTTLIPSISISDLHYPEHGQEPLRLLRRSGIALTLARKARDGYHGYQSGLDQHHDQERIMLRDLVSAVREQQLRVVYQPKIRIADGRVEGFEALLQWQHPSLGLLQPDEFLPLATQSGHMPLLSDWMLEHVIGQMAAWQALGRPQHVAVNLSAADLEDVDLAKRLVGWLNRYGVDQRLLMLEVTEQTVMRDPGLAAHLLGELREQGCQVAIDDFGTGYSSLTQLRCLPLDVLKIDKSFVIDLPHQPEDALIVDASIDLAHKFGLQVIAEGVETPQHLALLAQAGCDQAQGFLISRALDAENVTAWLEEYQNHLLVVSARPNGTLGG